MSLSFGLNAKLSTSQKLTPQMQQAIKLLQLSSLELAQEVQMKLDSNPMLERIEDEFDALNQTDDIVDNNLEAWNTSTLSDTQNTSYNNDENDDWSDFEEPSTFDNDAIDTQWEDIYIHETTSMARPDQDEFDDYQGATTACIQDHIRWQLNFKHLSDIDTLIADYLIDAMDDMGFIQIELQDIENSLSTIASFYQWDTEIDMDEITTVLHIIQSCEPLGVGARNLAECLTIQIKKLPTNTPYRTQALSLLSAAEYLVSNNIKALLKETQLTLEEIQPALDLIRTLNPYPGIAFINQQPQHDNTPESYDIPDVLVTAITEPSQNNAQKSETHWQVKLNPETLPKLRINQEYASLIKRGDDSPDNQYLKDHLTDARLFIRSIEERNQNLLKVATCIIKKQQAFLEHGATAMQPLILRDIAHEVDLHESTVSRLTNSKSILTPKGLFSLKYFFSSSVSGSDGDVSATAICAMIEKMIANENPEKPLSDSAIQKKLQADGIDLARRTVAKYRESMNIGSSTQRRQHF